MTTYVVRRQCGARWTAASQPRECRNPECGAGWLDLPQFVDKTDADKAAANLIPFSWPSDDADLAAEVADALTPRGL